MPGKSNLHRTLRLLLGDQLNHQHSWFKQPDPAVTYVLMEVRSETDYVRHHLQKVLGFFAAMRAFANQLRAQGHAVIYLTLDNPDNRQSLETNCLHLIESNGFTRFEYLLPDEYRVDQTLKKFAQELTLPNSVCDTEHFYTTRHELGEFFEGKKQLLMESFYRHMRKKHQVLMQNNQPLHGQWNFDAENRRKLPTATVSLQPLLFDNDVTAIYQMLQKSKIDTLGTVDPLHFVWPVTRAQALQLLHFFIEECLPHFGTYQDAMTPEAWSLYHSRLSFALNTKLLSPKEVVTACVENYEKNTDRIGYNQLEGFVRQIIGWREYMRGIYWLKMPAFASLNYFGNTAPLPAWYWTGKTRMACLRHSITQSLQHAYAHHIQRLMVTGNFALLAGVHPNEVDAWYLGIYIDALDWVEITNTRGMSQYADGGIVGTKPYVSSAAYIDKMSHYCNACFYKKALKTGARACPFNSLYWHFYARNEKFLAGNPRTGMMYNVWYKMPAATRTEILAQAETYLHNIDTL